MNVINGVFSGEREKRPGKPDKKKANNNPSVKGFKKCQTSPGFQARLIEKACVACVSFVLVNVHMSKLNGGITFTG